jgi:radical SAM protein with 4Fe4S-binding SPASM domain
MKFSFMPRLNHWAYRFNYVNAPRLNLKKPVDVSLELASECNQRCSYCYHADKVPFTKGIMALDTAKLIIAQAADLETPSIKFNWKGESTLNPHFAHITAFAKAHADSKTFIDRLTNSNFKFGIERDDIFSGLANQTKVKVSFDSFIPGVMEKQRAGSNPRIAETNITTFYNWPGRTTEIVIQAVRTQLNKDEDLKHEIQKRWPGVSVSIRDMVAGRVENDFVKKSEVKERDTSDRQSCIQAHARLIFNWDGVAFPCCVDIAETMPLGDIKTTDLAVIWRSEQARQLRKALLDKSAFACGACQKCSSFESYKGFKPSWKS